MMLNATQESLERLSTWKKILTKDTDKLSYFVEHPQELITLFKEFNGDLSFAINASSDVRNDLHLLDIGAFNSAFEDFTGKKNNIVMPSKSAFVVALLKVEDENENFNTVVRTITQSEVFKQSLRSLILAEKNHEVLRNLNDAAGDAALPAMLQRIKSKINLRNPEQRAIIFEELLRLSQDDANKQTIMNAIISESDEDILRLLIEVNSEINNNDADSYFKDAQKGIDIITKAVANMPRDSKERRIGEETMLDCHKALCLARVNINLAQQSHAFTAEEKTALCIDAKRVNAMHIQDHVHHHILKNPEIVDSALRTAARAAAWTFSILTAGLGAVVLMSTVGKQAFFAPADSVKVKHSAKDLSKTVANAYKNIVQNTTLPAPASAA